MRLLRAAARAVAAQGPLAESRQPARVAEGEAVRARPAPPDVVVHAAEPLLHLGRWSSTSSSACSESRAIQAPHSGHRRRRTRRQRLNPRAVPPATGSNPRRPSTPMTAGVPRSWDPLAGLGRSSGSEPTTVASASTRPRAAAGRCRPPSCRCPRLRRASPRRSQSHRRRAKRRRRRARRRRRVRERRTARSRGRPCRAATGPARRPPSCRRARGG